MDLSIEFDKFFELRFSLPRKIRFRANSHETPGMFSGECTPTSPIIIDTDSKPKKLHDFLGSSPYVFISDRVCEALRPFRGWTTYAVMVLDKHGESVGNYSGLVILGRCGEIVQPRNPEVHYEKPTPQASYRAWIRSYFEPSSWDGTDIFIPSNVETILVTQQVKSALESARASNVSFRPLAEL